MAVITGEFAIVRFIRVKCVFEGAWMRIDKISMISAVILLAMLGGCAKKPAIIKGRITDADGKPLAAAAVFTIPQEQTTLSDTAGYFVFDEVKPGEYSLMAKFESDSTIKLIGQVNPGENLNYDLVIFKSVPPPPPPPSTPPPDTTKVEKSAPPPRDEPPVTDPALTTGARVLHLGSPEFIKKFEIESSDGLVWDLKKEKDTKLRFQGGRLFEGYFAGPYHKYWETAARRLEYDGRIWIYIHGPEKVVDKSRAITIGIPLGLPANADIDSIVVEYGFPRFPDDYSAGDIQMRMIGETASDITVLMDWKRVDHAENGLIKKQVIIPKGANKKIDKINIETDSDGDAVWDDLMVRPLVYFSMQ
jgi:hypothetical protein